MRSCTAPFFGGEGAHPPADACDFARYCSELDFFALTDHAEGLTPSRWRRSIESLRDCNERAGDPANPDLVAYVGWEWTQTGATPEMHFGHKNVIFPGLADAELPARPISALADDVMQRARFMWLARSAEAALSFTAPAYADFLWWVRQLAGTPLCEPGVDVHAQAVRLPGSRLGSGGIVREARAVGLPSLVIPHGLTWGIHAPAGATLAGKLTLARHDPERQRLLEVYSGHGAAERFDAPRRARATPRAAASAASPPSTTCPAAGRPARSCASTARTPARRSVAKRVEEGAPASRSRRVAIRMGAAERFVEEWLDCDQVRGEFKSAFSPRPYESAQVALALESADERATRSATRCGSGSA
jgi:hypothetical protein